MKCAGAPDCPKPARYVVGTDGYCGTHQGDAFKRQKAIARAQDGARTEFDEMTRRIEHGLRVKEARFRTAHNRRHP